LCLEGLADCVDRYNRVKTETARDPDFTYTPQQYVLSYGETALYLSVLGNPTTGVAPIDYVKIFFGMLFPVKPCSKIC
jgi:hypothetical protein